MKSVKHCQYRDGGTRTRPTVLCLAYSKGNSVLLEMKYLIGRVALAKSDNSHDLLRSMIIQPPYTPIVVAKHGQCVISEGSMLPTLGVVEITVQNAPFLRRSSWMQRNVFLDYLRRRLHQNSEIIHRDYNPPSSCHTCKHGRDTFVVPST